MKNNRKSWITVCFLLLASVLYSCVAVSENLNGRSEIFNHLFPGRIADSSNWVKVAEINLPRFYRAMPKEFKLLNPAEAYFNESYQAGVIVTYGKVIKLNSMSKMCLMEVDATYYVEKGSGEPMILAGKSLYIVWDLVRSNETCKQSAPSQYILIEDRLPMSHMKKALLNEKLFLNQCFAESKIAKRDMKLTKIASSQSLDGSDVYLNFTGSGLNVTLGLSLQDEGWHFNGCEEIFD